MKEGTLLSLVAGKGLKEAACVTLATSVGALAVRIHGGVAPNKLESPSKQAAAGRSAI